jgi:hypothetical protein
LTALLACNEAKQISSKKSPSSIDYCVCIKTE